MDLIAIDTLDGPVLIDTFPPIVPTAADIAAVAAVIAKYASTERSERHPGHSPQSVHGRKGAGSTKGLHEPDGGFTIDTGGKAIRTGWSVAVEGTSKFMSAEQFESDRQGRKEFVAGFLRDARGQGVKAIGGWHDPAPDAPGKAIVLDHVRIFPKEQHDMARAFAVANNQKSMANLDAIAAGDWDNAIEDTGGTGDRGRILAHGEDTAHHGRVRHPAGRDVGRADRRPGGGGRRRHGRQPGFVDLEATYGLILRHPGHADQKVHGNWASSTPTSARESWSRGMFCHEEAVMAGKYPMQRTVKVSPNPYTPEVIAADLDSDGIDPIIAELFEIDDGDEDDE